MNKNIFEKLMWSIAFPGFGQYLNGKYFKGTVLLLLEFLINVQANFNQMILLSFHGEIEDAVKDAGRGKDPYSFLPYVFAAFFVTVGLIFSSNITIFGVLLGPVWLPMLFVFPGIIIGFIIREIISNIS